MKIDIRVEFDDKNLQKLLKDINIKKNVEIGTFDSANALKGAQHEFGSITNNVPQRSWLRSPLMTKKEKLYHIAQKTLTKQMETQTIDATALMTKIGIAGESIVQEAFDTGGFGQWQPLKPKTISRKKTNKILVDQGFFIRSVESKVI